MVFILDGISYTDAHGRRNICYLTCIRLSISSRTGTNRVFLPEKYHDLLRLQNWHCGYFTLHHFVSIPLLLTILFLRAKNDTRIFFFSLFLILEMISKTASLDLLLSISLSLVIQIGVKLNLGVRFWGLTEKTSFITVILKY